MKYQIIIITLFLCFMINSSIAQQNSITISGGYTFSNIENIDESSSGWRINALYEYISRNGNLSNGISLGYIRTEATNNDPLLGSGETKFKAGHWPIYYVPKYTFLKQESIFRPFVKGALGWHFSYYDIEGNIGGNFDTGDSGFYGGLGAGFTINVSELVLLNLEYEWAYLSNSWYRDGFMNSVMLGIGFKF